MSTNYDLLGCVEKDDLLFSPFEYELVEFDEHGIPTCPEVGEFIGYKAVFIQRNDNILDNNLDYGIAILLIPSEAKRVSPISKAILVKKDRCFKIRSDKRRCEFAKVLKIEDLDGNEYTTGYGIYYGHPYNVNEYVYPDAYDPREEIECSHGIHFFMGKNEAKSLITGEKIKTRNLFFYE